MATLDLGNVMGPQGPQGSIWYWGTSITGISTTGTVFSGSGVTLARVYDKYLNTSTGNVYTCVLEGGASVAKWAYIGNAKGPTGPTGPVGPTGSVDMNTPIEFTESETLANIESGESVATIFGKLKKIAGSMLLGAASTLLGNNLTAARALVSDVNGKVGVSTITAEELGYLDGLTGNVQTKFNQLNEKISTTTIQYRDKELISGITISIYKTGNMVTCKIGGSPGVNIDSGQKNAYVDLPDEYLPGMAMNNICNTQNGGKYIFHVNDTTKKVGIYFIFNSISANEQVNAIISWAAKAI